MIVSLFFTMACSNPSPALSPATGNPAATTPKPGTSSTPTAKPGTAPVASPTTTANGTLEVRVTDPTTLIPGHIWVTVQNIEAQYMDGTWKSVSSETKRFDLEAIHGVEQILAGKALPGGFYGQIRFDVTGVSVETGGSTVNATILVNKLSIAKLFEVAPNKTTVITLDFDGDRSVLAIPTGRYDFRPVIQLLVTRPAGSGEVPALDINTVSLPFGYTGEEYKAPLQATGGKKPYTWNMMTGELPAGLVLDPATGIISGVPVGSELSEFAVKISDSSTPPMYDTQSLAIYILY